jgi:uncharacterized protein
MPTGEARIFEQAGVTGFLHEPEKPSGDALVLTHGAGGNCRSPLLIRVAEAFAQAGLYVLRMDLPYRQRRPFGPPFPAQAMQDRDGIRRAAVELRTLASRNIFLGGHSYGGRQASILVSEDATAGAGLLLLSYPLHPPKKPQELRTDHFPKLERACLFVQGTKDPFGSVEELRNAVELIPRAKEIAVVEGAGHELAKGEFAVEDLVVRRSLNVWGVEPQRVPC